MSGAAPPLFQPSDERDQAVAVGELPKLPELPTLPLPPPPGIFPGGLDTSMMGVPPLPPPPGIEVNTEGLGGAGLGLEGELNAHRMDMKLENGDLPALPSVAIPNLPLPNPLNFISPPGMPPLPGQVPLDMMPPLPPPHFDSFPGGIPPLPGLEGFLPTPNLPGMGNFAGMLQNGSKDGSRGELKPPPSKFRQRKIENALAHLENLRKEVEDCQDSEKRAKLEERYKAATASTALAAAVGSGPGSTTSCTNCGCERSPIWRRNPYTGALLCNACGIYFTRNKSNRPLDKEKERKKRPGTSRKHANRGGGGGGGGSGGGEIQQHFSLPPMPGPGMGMPPPMAHLPAGMNGLPMPPPGMGPMHSDPSSLPNLPGLPPHSLQLPPPPGMPGGMPFGLHEHLGLGHESKFDPNLMAAAAAAAAAHAHVHYGMPGDASTAPLPTVNIGPGEISLPPPPHFPLPQMPLMPPKIPGGHEPLQAGTLPPPPPFGMSMGFQPPPMYHGGHETVEHGFTVDMAGNVQHIQVHHFHSAG